MDDDIIGIVRVPLSAFYFSDDAGREQDQAIVWRLIRLFRRVGCKPNRLENHIDGAVDIEAWKTILSASGHDETGLVRLAQDRRYPKIECPPHSIQCLDGRHRIAAAQVLVGDKAWWTVRLRQKDRDVPGQNRPSFFSHQTKYSDGEIYRNIRHNQMAQHEGWARSAQEWRLQLTPCKEKSLNLLLRRDSDGNLERRNIVEALDQLLRFPGLWGGLQLGNIHKHLALHCDEEVTSYLTHICLIWTKILGSHPVSVDLETVKRLQRAIPSDPDDSQEIRQLFRQKKVFRDVDDVARGEILNNILDIDVLIPSIETFHENMKLFSIAARILRHYVARDKLDAGTYQPVKNETLRQNLSEAFIGRNPSVMEYHEGDLRPVLAFDNIIYYQQLFLSAIRNFPYLSTEAPLQDRRGQAMPAGLNLMRLSELHWRAERLGFMTPKIRARADYGLQPPTSHSQGGEGSASNWSHWRGGKPSIDVFVRLTSTAFYPNLVKASPGEVTPELVLNDFMKAFFGEAHYAVANLEYEQMDLADGHDTTNRQRRRKARFPPAQGQHHGQATADLESFDASRRISDAMEVDGGPTGQSIQSTGTNPQLPPQPVQPPPIQTPIDEAQAMNRAPRSPAITRQSALQPFLNQPTHSVELHGAPHSSAIIQQQSTHPVQQFPALPVQPVEEAWTMEVDVDDTPRSPAIDRYSAQRQLKAQLDLAQLVKQLEDHPASLIPAAEPPGTLPTAGSSPGAANKPNRTQKSKDTSKQDAIRGGSSRYQLRKHLIKHKNPQGRFPVIPQQRLPSPSSPQAPANSGRITKTQPYLRITDRRRKADKTSQSKTRRVNNARGADEARADEARRMAEEEEEEEL